MVRTNCAVYGCLSTSKYNKDLKFHRFPRDERRQLWIEACQRPDLKNKTVEQLYNMHVCGLHFEKWMYMKTKLKSNAIPISNLPSASLHPMSTQTETIKTETETTKTETETTKIESETIKKEITEDLTDRGFQQQIDIASVDVPVVASTRDQATQTTKKIADHTPRKRKLRRQVTSCAKNLKLMEDAKSTDLTYEQFLQGCDKFLSPYLSKCVKAEINFKLQVQKKDLE